MNWNSNTEPRFEGKIAITLILLILIPISTTAFSHEPNFDPQPLNLEMDGSDIEYEKIEPIKVDGDEGFSEDYWEGNGTKENPYELKENYSINATGHEYGIKVDDVDDYFVIENVEIYGASGDTGAGIHLDSTRNAEVVDCNLHNNDIGIHVVEARLGNDNVINGNQIIDNDLGIYITNSEGVLFKNNDVSYNTEKGIHFDYMVNDNEVIDNTISNNGGSGIEIQDFTPNNLIKGNTIFENSDSGIHLHNSASENQITENLIENNTLGIQIEDSFDNKIWKNQFVENTEQALDNGDNYWNLTDPADGGEGGNYWSDYTGEDRGDGIGDTPYEIEGDNQDNYPWVTSEMSLYSVDRFKAFVDNTTAGETPTIEISEAYDEGDNLLDDEYTVTIELDGEVLTEDLIFTDGEANFTCEKLTEADEYSAEVTIEEVTRTATFFIQPSDPESINIGPEMDQTIKAGESINFSAEVYDEYGNLITEDNTDFTWNNTDETGLFDETTSRDYDVNATHEGMISDTITVTVEPAEVHEVVIDPEEDQTITVGETIDFDAKAFDEYDNLITDDDTVFIWENATDGTFDETTVGDYEVYATYGGVTSLTVTVTVEKGDVAYIEINLEEDFTLTAGEEENFSAEAYDEYDNLITDDDTTFTWNNTDEYGLFDETTAGDYEVWTEYEGVSSPIITVTVEPAEVDEVVIDPEDDQEIESGDAIPFKAEAFDEYGNLITGDDTEFEWENASSRGTFNKTTLGEYEVTATFEGKENISSKSINVIVRASQVDSIKLESPSDTNITAGEGDLEFTAKVYDEYNNLITEDPNDFIWENASKGKFFITSAGEYEVTARFKEEKNIVSTPSIVAVKPAEVHSVELEIASENNITAGQEVRFQAKAYDRYENLVTEDPQDFDWKNSSNGTFNKTSTGEYEVMVEYEGEMTYTSKPINVTVEASQVHSLELKEPQTTTLKPGDYLGFDASAYDRYDNLIEEDNTNFTWENASKGSFKETTAGEYEVRAIYHDEEVKATSESITVLVQTAELHEFDLRIEDVTASERPEIEIIYMRDSFGNPLEGEYEVEISIDGNTKDENLTFTEGSSHYYWEEIKLADQYSTEIDINGISRSKDFQVKPGRPAFIDIDQYNETVVEGSTVSYTSVAYDEWNNKIGDVSSQTDWSIEKDAGGNWTKSEYETGNNGNWTITAVYTSEGEELTDSSTLTVLPKVEGFKYSGLNAIIFEQNLDYHLKWNLSENNVISSYEVLAGKSPDELETIDTGIKNESYLYQFEDGEIVYFKIIGRNEKEEEVEAIDFEVTVDLLKLEVEDREKKIFSVDISEERKEEVNVTWFIDGEAQETGEVFIPDVEPGKHNITAEVSGQEHVVELTHELYIEGGESEEESIIIYVIMSLAALLLFGIPGIAYMRSTKDTENKDELHFYEERKSNNKSKRNEGGIKHKRLSTKSDRKNSLPPPPPGLTGQSKGKNQGSNDVSSGIDNDIMIETFEDIEKATKKEVYAELTGRSGQTVNVQNLEEKIENLVQKERLTMQPRKDKDTLYIWNDSGSQLN